MLIGSFSNFNIVIGDVAYLKKIIKEQALLPSLVVK